MASFDFRLVALAWDNSNNHAGGSNHEAQGRYQKGVSRGIAPGSNECGSLNHCARFVFPLSRAIDYTDSPSYVAKTGPHVKPRFRHDLGSRVTSHFAVSNASSGLL